MLRSLQLSAMITLSLPRVRPGACASWTHTPWSRCIPATAATATSHTVATTAPVRRGRGRPKNSLSAELVIDEEAACSEGSTAATTAVMPSLLSDKPPSQAASKTTEPTISSRGTSALPDRHATPSDGTDLEQSATVADVHTIPGSKTSSNPASPTDSPHFLEQLEVPNGDVCFSDMSFELRPYQQEAITASLEHWKQGTNGQMLSLPTGTGKTIIFCALLRYLAEQKKRIFKQQQEQLQSAPSSSSSNSAASSSTSHEDGGAHPSTNSSGSSSSSKGSELRCLILAHRDELLQQAVAKLQNVVWPGVNLTMVNARVKDFTGQVRAAVRNLPN